MGRPQDRRARRTFARHDAERNAAAKFVCDFSESRFSRDHQFAQQFGPGNTAFLAGNVQFNRLQQHDAVAS
jgi:hypothetical protein